MKLPKLKSARYDIRYLFKQAIHNPNKKTRRYYQKLYNEELQRRQKEVISRKFTI